MKQKKHSISISSNSFFRILCTNFEWLHFWQFYYDFSPDFKNTDRLDRFKISTKLIFIKIVCQMSHVSSISVKMMKHLCNYKKEHNYVCTQKERKTTSSPKRENYKKKLLYLKLFSSNKIQKYDKNINLKNPEFLKYSLQCILTRHQQYSQTWIFVCR